jgi:hypothetical protein
MLTKNVLVFEVNLNQELLYPNPSNGADIFNGTELHLLGCCLNMACIYGILQEAFLGLHHPQIGQVFEVMRNFYEALVIFSFMQLLLTFLEG